MLYEVITRVAMTDIGQMPAIFVAQRIDADPVPADVTGAAPREATECTQQSGFATTVAANDMEQLASAQRKRQVTYERSICSRAFQVQGLEHSAHSLNNM